MTYNPDLFQSSSAFQDAISQKFTSTEKVDSFVEDIDKFDMNSNTNTRNKVDVLRAIEDTKQEWYRVFGTSRPPVVPNKLDLLRGEVELETEVYVNKIGDLCDFGLILESSIWTSSFLEWYLWSTGQKPQFSNRTNSNNNNNMNNNMNHNNNNMNNMNNNNNNMNTYVQPQRRGSSSFDNNTNDNNNNDAHNGHRHGRRSLPIYKNNKSNKTEEKSGPTIGSSDSQNDLILVEKSIYTIKDITFAGTGKDLIQAALQLSHDDGKSIKWDTRFQKQTIVAEIKSFSNSTYNYSNMVGYAQVFYDANHQKDINEKKKTQIFVCGGSGRTAVFQFSSKKIRDYFATLFVVKQLNVRPVFNAVKHPKKIHLLYLF